MLERLHQVDQQAIGEIYSCRKSGERGMEVRKRAEGGQMNSSVRASELRSKKHEKSERILNGYTCGEIPVRRKVSENNYRKTTIAPRLRSPEWKSTAGRDRRKNSRLTCCRQWRAPPSLIHEES